MGAGLALALAGCASNPEWAVSSEPARMIPGLPGEGWVALPLGRFVTRDTVRPEVMEFCRTDRCGFDAVVTRFAASGPEARELERTAADPARLVQAIRQRHDTRPPRYAGPIGATPPPRKTATVRAEPFAAADWHGAVVDVTGGTDDRAAYGAVLERGTPDGVAVVVVIAGRRDVAQRLAAAAALSGQRETAAPPAIEGRHALR